MRLITLGAVIVAGVVSGAWSSGTQQAPGRFAQLDTLVKHAVGPRPVDCGFILIGRGDPPVSLRELDEAVRCVVTHAAKKQAAWLRIRLPGFDSEVANGLMTDANGRTQVYDFDSDPSGGSRTGSRFITQECPNPRAKDTEKFGAYIACVD
jgi:hypothetical protein